VEDGGSFFLEKQAGIAAGGISARSQPFVINSRVGLDVRRRNQRANEYLGWAMRNDADRTIALLAELIVELAQ